MPITLGLNIAALKAGRQLKSSEESLATSFQRLSSGLRINSAKDDAAGVALASSLQVDAKIYGQALRNTNDAISLLNIASAALGELSSLVLRQKELATQAANGTFTSTQRQALDAEAQALVSEYSRVVATTEFNQIKILDGSRSEVSIQLGVGTQNALSLVLGDMSSFAQSTEVTGTGILTAGSVPVSNDTRDAAAADVNNDGILDLLSVGTPGIMHWALGNGNGTFKAASGVGLVSSARGVRSMDLDGDGNSDVVVAYSGATSIGVFLGNGNGTFDAVRNYGAITTPYRIELGDLNGDGRADVVVGTSNTYDVVLLNNGNGTFMAPITAIVVDQGAYSPRLADVDNDDVLDIIYAGIFSSDQYGVALGNGNGTFKAPILISSSGDPNAPAVGDFNGDSNIDLIFGFAASSYSKLFIGNGNGTFKVGTTIASPITGHGSAAAYDSNSDGYLDYVVTGSTNNKVLLYLGNGNGTFKAPSSFSTTNEVDSLITADLNGDGVEDLVSGGGSTTSQINYFISGTSTTTTNATISLLTQASALEAIDLLEGVANSIESELGRIGSYQSRLEFAMNMIATLREQAILANARIVDLDVASEVANMLRLQIIQQSAAAIFASANQQTKVVIELLSM